MKSDYQSLSHATWDCKYHVVWIPKYRRKAIYAMKKRIIVDSIKRWAQARDVTIVEGYAMKDHIHLCLSIPPKYSVSSIIGLLKGKSASEVMSYGKRVQKLARGRQFWARGYCVSTVGQNEEVVRKYIREQEREDLRQEQLKLQYF